MNSKNSKNKMDKFKILSILLLLAVVVKINASSQGNQKIIAGSKVGGRTQKPDVDNQSVMFVTPNCKPGEVFVEGKCRRKA